jgi:hypothetical protein
MSTRNWEPLPRSVEGIKEWYRASQIEEDEYCTPLELPPQVIHQISVSLSEDRPLAAIHLKRLIEYAAPFEDEPRVRVPEPGRLDFLPVPKDPK